MNKASMAHTTPSFEQRLMEQVPSQKPTTSSRPASTGNRAEPGVDSAGQQTGSYDLFVHHRGVENRPNGREQFLEYSKFCRSASGEINPHEGERPSTRCGQAVQKTPHRLE